MTEATNDLEVTFDEWMKQVNARCVDVAGVSADDLPDQEWREWYESGLAANEAADTALENEGFNVPDEDYLDEDDYARNSAAFSEPDDDYDEDDEDDFDDSGDDDGDDLDFDEDDGDDEGEGEWELRHEGTMIVSKETLTPHDRWLDFAVDLPVSSPPIIKAITMGTDMETFTVRTALGDVVITQNSEAKTLGVQLLLKATPEYGVDVQTATPDADAEIVAAPRYDLDVKLEVEQIA